MKTPLRAALVANPHSIIRLTWFLVPSRIPLWLVAAALLASCLTAGTKAYGQESGTKYLALWGEVRGGEILSQAFRQPKPGPSFQGFRFVGVKGVPGFNGDFDVEFSKIDGVLSVWGRLASGGGDLKPVKFTWVKLGDSLGVRYARSPVDAVPAGYTPGGTYIQQKVYNIKGVQFLTRQFFIEKTNELSLSATFHDAVCLATSATVKPDEGDFPGIGLSMTRMADPNTQLQGAYAQFIPTDIKLDSCTVKIESRKNGGGPNDASELFAVSAAKNKVPFKIGSPADAIGLEGTLHFVNDVKAGLSFIYANTTKISSDRIGEMFINSSNTFADSGKQPSWMIIAAWPSDPTVFAKYYPAK